MVHRDCRRTEDRGHPLGISREGGGTLHLSPETPGQRGSWEILTDKPSRRTQCSGTLASFPVTDGRERRHSEVMRAAPNRPTPF